MSASCLYVRLLYYDVDAEVKFPCRIRVNHHLAAVNPDQLLSARWSHVSRRL